MKRTARLLFLAALLPLAAHAQGVRDGNGNVVIRDDVAASRGMDPRKPFFTLSVDNNGNYVAPGGGSGGSAASQTASNATDGQATSTTNQQNLVFNMLFNGTTWDRARGTGGAANVLAGLYSATLPTMTSGVPGAIAVDINGRIIQAPGASVTVSNFPASQAVTNAGTFPVQNTAAVVGGNTTAVKTDGSATTQPISASTLPLPTGAATATNQAAEIAALGAPGDAANASTIVGQLKYASARLALVRTTGPNVDLNFAAVASPGTLTGTARAFQADYARFNVWLGCSQAATYQLQGSVDGFASVQIVAAGSVPAGSAAGSGGAGTSGVSISTPQTFSAYRTVIVNPSGGAAGNCTALSSFSAN
jgi:hypothetical protein